jgi:hypothetical protein
LFKIVLGVDLETGDEIHDRKHSPPPWGPENLLPECGGRFTRE